MLPVYREASMHGQSLWAQRDVWQSGACELHLVLCQSLSIQNYPTVVLYLGREQELVLHIGVFDSSTFVNFLTLLDERSFATPLHDGSTTWVRWERSQKPSALQLTYRLLVVSFKALSSGQPDGCYGTRRLCSSPDGCWSTDVRLLHAVVPALLAAQVHV